MPNEQLTRVIAAWIFAVFAALTLALPTEAVTSTSPARDSSFNSGWRFSCEEVAGGQTVTGWRWAPGDPKQFSYHYNGLSINGGPPELTSTAWQDYALGSDVLQGKPGYTWFQATLPATLGPDRLGRVVRLDLHPPSMATVDAQLLKGIKQEDAFWVVLLNGTVVSQQSGNSGPFSLDLNRGWHDGGPNVLTVLVDNKSAMQGGLGDVQVADRPAPTQMAAGFDDDALGEGHPAAHAED